MRRINSLFLTILCILPAMLRAQESKSFRNGLLLEGKVHYGWIVPHHRKMQHLTESHFTSFEINIGQLTSGKQMWEQLYRYPVKGIGLFYSDLGGSKYFGSALAVFPYLTFPVAGQKALRLNFRFGTGLAYIFKPFNRLENYKNNAIGSRFNAFIQLMYELKWQASRQLYVSAGIGISHMSNGAVKTPNLGINIPTLSAGITYKPFKEEVVIINRDLPKADRSWEFDILANAGISELYGSGGKKYWAYGITANFNKPLGLKRKLSAGLDIYYDQAVVESLDRGDILYGNKLTTIRPGITIGHILVFSHLSFIVQLGAYLYTKEKSDGYVYDRVGLQWLFKKHYIVNLALKTHFAKADLIEWGIGYRF